MNKFNKLAIGLFFLLSLLTPTYSILRFGLISKNNEESLNLLDLKTKAVIQGPYAEIQYIHTYKNSYDHTLETEFYFPRTENSVFYKFEAVFRNQTIVGQILEKTKAKEMYEWNVERGNTVAYSERNALTPDVMQVQVGNIPAHESVEIRFSVIQPLEVIINKFWGFTLLSVLTERYAPASVDPSQVPNIQNVDLKHSSYKEWKIEVEIKADQPFSYINNPSHNLKPELSEVPAGSNSKIYKAIWNVTVVPDKNFVVYFRSDKIEQPSIIQATHPNYTDDHVLLINFVPQLNKLDTAKAQKFLEKGEEGFLQLKNLALKEDVETAKGEFIFVIDRSGSMQGQRIVNLKKALEKFLTILPKDSLFNILSFGSMYSLYKTESLQFNQKNLEEAIAWIHTIDADMGGTEILPALREITSVPLVQGYPRTMMVLTDGDVFNPSEVINHVREHSDKVRVCSVGIGHGASEYLVKNIAKAGRCTSEFVLDNEDIGDKAIYMIKAAISQYLENIEFNIECFNSKKKSVYKEESKQGLLLKDEPFKKWVYLVNISDVDYCDAKIGYYNSLKKEKATEKLRIDGFKTAEVTSVWHKVAYDSKLKEFDLEVKAQGRDFESMEKLKGKIIELSLRYQILSDYTSFLAVLDESTVDPSEGRIKQTIHNLDSADYASIPDASARYGGGRVHTTNLYAKRASRNLGAGGAMESAKFAAAPSMAYDDLSLGGGADYDGAPIRAFKISPPQKDSQIMYSMEPESFVSQLQRNVNYVGWIIGGLLLASILYVLIRGGKKSGDNLKKE